MEFEISMSNGIKAKKLGVGEGIRIILVLVRVGISYFMIVEG